MTRRAVIVGVGLGLLVAGSTYFNDQVIRQTYLTANHLPASVFGFALLLVLVVNPLVGLSRRLRPFSAAELAVIIALGLPVCGWAGSNLLRYFAGVVSKPAVMAPLQPAWQSTRVMSYLPGGSALLAEGYVRDWLGLWQAVTRAMEGEGPAAVVELVARLSEAERQRLAGPTPGAGAEEPDVSDAATRSRLLDLLNAALRRDAASHEEIAARRDALDAALPEVLRPRPRGAGLLLNDGRPHPRAIDALIAGRGPEQPLALWDLPWSVWWPTLRLWLGMALLLGLASLCLMVIVHPQWSRRELLPYPTVQFVREATAGLRDGAAWPAIFRSRLFWVAFVLVLGIHSVNGLHAWFPALPTMPRQLQFSPLRDLFPNAARVYGSHGMFEPVIYFTVIGFGFFIPTAVSLSLGLSLVFWMALGAWLLSQGATLDIGHFNDAANGNAMRMGAYLGLTLMIAYFGRRYYAAVARAAAGLGGGERGSTACWAARLLVLTGGGAMLLLTVAGGVDPVMSFAVVALLLVIFLVLARINVETGLFYAQPDWLPGIAMAGLLGARGMGIEALIVLSLASVILVADPREAVAPYVANALRLSDAIARVRLGRAARMLAGMLVLGLVVATAVTLWLQYRHGLNAGDTWSNRMLPSQTFNVAARSISTLEARGELGEATRVIGLDHLRQMNPQPRVWPYLGIGVALVLATAGARLRLPWWPIHPVLFVVWGSYPANHFAFSFLLAALAKGATARLGGARAVAAARPLAVGLIAGELLGVIVWSIVGTSYYFSTGQTPVPYRIFP